MRRKFSGGENCPSGRLFFEALCTVAEHPVLLCEQDMDQLGKVVNLARGRLNRENGPTSRLRILSRETGLAVPFRVSLLILHTQAESGPYVRDSSRFSRRISPEFVRSRQCMSMAFTAESPPAQGQ